MSSETHLPESVSDWPREPHKVLGTGPCPAKREVRRAYASLLRRFRPDEHPEAFNRLLEARDYLLRVAKFYEQGAETVSANTNGAGAESTPDSIVESSQNDSPPREPATSEAAATLFSGDEASGQIRQPEHQGPADVATLTTAWQHVINGDYELAHAKLRDVLSADGKAAIALYWLERLVDDVRREETRPVDWLLDHGQCLPIDTLTYLLQEQAATDEHLMLDDRLRALIPVHREAAHGIINWRWIAAVRAQRPEVLSDDLDLVESSIHLTPEPWWLLACSVMSLTTDGRFTKLMDHCFAELRKAEWDRIWSTQGPAEEVYEEALEARDSLIARRSISNRNWIYKLIIDAPLHPCLQKEYLEEKFAEWWSKPDLAMAKLDVAGRATPMLLHRFLRFITRHSEYDYRRNVAAASVALNKLADAKNYARARDQIASISRTFVVPTASICHTLRRDNEASERVKWEILSALSEDNALHTLTAGWCVYAIPLTQEAHTAGTEDYLW